METELLYRNVLFGFCLFVALQSDDKRYTQLKLLCGFDDTLSNVIAPHDTTEDVEKDRADGLVG